MNEVKALKFSWEELSEKLATEIEAILGRKVRCAAKPDDEYYWCIGFPDARMPLSDVFKILESLNASARDRIDSVPPESEHAVDVSSIGKLAKQGRSRPDGKSLSRVAQLIPANKGDFLFIADSGPGETNAKGLIVPKFGNKPENHVAVNMTFESLSEFFLMTKMHYQMWLASWYVHNPIRPVSKQQVQSQSNHIEPNSNAVPMF